MQFQTAFSCMASRALMALAVVPLLGACAISTPFPRLKMSGAGAEDQVVVVLTHIVVDSNQRSEFDRQTRRVIDSLPSHSGMLGYSARRQIFGNEAWTMSMWASDADRAGFVRSAVHQEAIAKSAPAVVNIQLKRLSLTRKDVPAGWPRALELMAEPGDLRTYGQ